MAAPGDVAQMPAKNREEAEDFDAEEGERKYVGCGRKAGGEDCGCHEGGVGGERCRESEEDEE